MTLIAPIMCTTIRAFMNKLLFLLLFCLQYNVYAQDYDANFAHYLIHQHQKEEAVAYLKQHQSGVNSDSVNLLLGSIHFTDKDMPRAIACFTQVRSGSSAYHPTLLYLSVAYAYTEEWLAADSVLSLFQPQLAEEADMRNCMASIVALGAGNVQQYRSLDSLVKDSGFWYADSRQRVKETLLPLVEKHQPKPWKAAVLSAVLPGTGKWYAGRPYDGLATFLQTSVIGAIAAEGYLNAGLQSVRFIAGASLYALFYAGNILGSIHAVKVKQQQNKTKIKDEAVRHLHIIVRNYFS